MSSQFFDPFFLFVLAKITAVLLTVLVISTLLKSPKHRSALWATTIFSLPFIVALSSTSLIKIIPTLAKETSLSKEVASDFPLVMQQQGPFTLEETTFTNSLELFTLPLESSAPLEAHTNSILPASASEILPLPTEKRHPSNWLPILFFSGIFLTLAPMLFSLTLLLFLKKT